MSDTPDSLPPGVLALCDEFDLEQPTPGERWEFDLANPPTDISDRLVRAGCQLRCEYATDNGRRYEYVVPEAGWPDPLGYVTTDDPQWVGPQHGWNPADRYHGNVRGSIPSPGDCDRHPDLPANAYALSRVTLYPPKSEAKFHAKTSLEPPTGAWVAVLTYEQATRSHSSHVGVYSSELGEFPECTKWTSAPYTNDERRHVEWFDTLEDATTFVKRETGLAVPPRSD
ncbi:hypothetical protein D8Y22_05540 [Salinadaptatus halalkaliphilus]|uniref:Uncharacterized protein n=1 Tax=Salinadaptatus halalkaliphilus TaxID=2419781 RepID=A0A4S3TTA8_9EURY|nr:hypothetical protein [Salinadaptatus halalkaliphilus]THE65848.1 hypothetical protein D8Y22_05540 [Salinadaptatus halalkaliphilus]